MKKKIIAIATLMLMAVAPAMSQVFVLEDDEANNRGELTEGDFGVMVPRTNVEYDQWKYTPMGEGIVMLAGLAGAYLLGKRKKEQE